MDAVRLTLVPHTHWDREWYAPFDEFRDRLVAMMDSLLELGEAGFPHFHLDGQMAMVDDYLAVRPEREDDLRRLAADGRLSLGPWFTQMDEFLTSGESHVRNLERGLARARSLGEPLHVGYMPDQFGHVGQMPQILRSAGIDRAVVWRGVPRSIDRATFWWESPDGSGVLTEYMAFGYFNGARYRQAETPEQLAEAILASVEQLRPFLCGDRMLVMVGYDHAGPDAAFPDRLEAARPRLDGVVAEVAGIAHHLAGQEARGHVPVWRGELRSSARAHLLPNVYSARIHQKRERAHIESLLERYAEPLAALVPGFEWPAEALERAWTLLLWNGAHDSVCGCSHDQVAREVDARHAEARAVAETVTARAIDSLGSQVEQPGTLRFNPSPFEREGVPGLGWRVDPGRVSRPDAPIDIHITDGWIAAGGLRLTLRDEPDVGDLYNFCPASPDWQPAPPDVLELVQGGVAARSDGVDVELSIRRSPDEPFVVIRGLVDNRRPDHRLRVHIRLPEEAERALAGSPFELVERGLVSEGSDLEAPSPTWPAQGVVLAGGLAVYHQGVFEYEIVDGRELAITVLRCVGTISRESIATRPWPAGPDVATPDAQMIGSSAFSFGIETGARREELMRTWERFALPLHEQPVGGGGSLPASGNLLELSGDAVLSNVRRARDELQVRVWNPLQDRRVEARIAGGRHLLPPAAIRRITLASGRASR